VTADVALDLAGVLGTSPRFWMNLQATIDNEISAVFAR
jgi:plasmid maintenance system antidote protein VapI